MVSRRGISRLSRRDIDDMERQRALARKAAEVLKQLPKPDTFIGRKTQEPFPKEVPRRRWLAEDQWPEADDGSEPF
jgi:hypothetical protein